MEVPRMDVLRVRGAQQGGVRGAGKAPAGRRGVQAPVTAPPGRSHRHRPAPPAMRVGLALLARPGPWSCATARRPVNLSQGASGWGLCLWGAAEASGIKTSFAHIAMLAEAGLCFQSALLFLSLWVSSAPID